MFISILVFKSSWLINSPFPLALLRLILLLCFLFLFIFYPSILSFISWIIFHTIRCVINQSFPHRLPLASDSQVSSLPAAMERCTRTADKSFYIRRHTLTDIFFLCTHSLEEEKENQTAIIIMFNY